MSYPLLSYSILSFFSFLPGLYICLFVPIPTIYTYIPCLQPTTLLINRNPPLPPPHPPQTTTPNLQLLRVLPTNLQQRTKTLPPDLDPFRGNGNGSANICDRGRGRRNRSIRDKKKSQEKEQVEDFWWWVLSSGLGISRTWIKFQGWRELFRMDDLHYIAEIYPSTTRFVNERALRGKKKKKKKKVWHVGKRGCVIDMSSYVL